MRQVIRMGRELNIAVIGLGRMGRIYAHTIADIDDARLYAVATEAVAAEDAFLSPLDVPHRSDEAAEAFALDAVDAVVIATSTSTHRRLVEEAAEAGKAVFCEKPLALTLDDTRAAIDAAAQAGVPLQVGFMRRYDADYIEAKAAIDAGKIGRPVTFRSTGRDPFCPHPSYADPAHSGGLIVDMGIHDMDLARWLMGAEIERVSAEATVMVCDGLRDVGDFDNAVVNLRFDNGAVGNVEVSRNAFYGYDIRTEVLGSGGSVRVGHDRLHSEMLLKAKRVADESYLIKRFGAAYRAQIRHFVECVRLDRSPACTGADALAAFEVSLAATYSARTGNPVTLEAVRSGWTPTYAAAR